MTPFTWWLFGVLCALFVVGEIIYRIERKSWDE